MKLLLTLLFLFSFNTKAEKMKNWKHLYKCYYDSQLLCENLAKECFSQLQGSVEFYLASQCYINYVQCLNDTKKECEK